MAKDVAIGHMYQEDVDPLLRILQVYHDFYPKRGGIEDHVLTLCQTLPPTVESTVLTGADSPATHEEVVEGIRTIRVGSWGRYYTPLCPALPGVMRRVPSDIVHIHMPCPMGEIAFLLARPDVPLILSYHNDIVRQPITRRLYAPFLRQILKRADRILVSTSAYRDTSTALKDFAGKCQVVPYGIDIERFRPTPAVMRQAQALQSRFARPIILFVGRLCHYKGLEYLIPAMEQLDAALLIVGKGPLEKDVRRLIARHGGEVHLAGFVSDQELPAYYYASQMVVFPSTIRSEAFGLVQLHAQACSHPVIASDLPGVSTVTRHGKTGLIIPPLSSEAIVDAASRLLGSSDLRQEMGSGGYRRVTELYQAQRMVERIQNIYQEVYESR
jgi:glycosyltransferase involved in cell wall biosynthesis